MTAIVGDGGASGALRAEGVRLRVVCNRDELDTRRPALPPSMRVIGDRRVVMPIDPESGGTWIAANDAGLVFVLLNVNAESVLTSGRRSRGTIIPALADCTTVTTAARRARDLGLHEMRPFRLLVLDDHELAECWLDGARLRHRRGRLERPVMRTSSGLGDALVTGPRRALFRRLFRRPASLVAAQDAFHTHRWPNRGPVSVTMQRPGARTVSRTIVELGHVAGTLAYSAIESPRMVTLSVPLTSGSHTPRNTSPSESAS